MFPNAGISYCIDITRKWRKTGRFQDPSVTRTLKLTLESSLPWSRIDWRKEWKLREFLLRRDVRHKCIQMIKHNCIHDIFSPSIGLTVLLLFLATVVERSDTEDRFVTMTLTQNFLGHIWTASITIPHNLNKNLVELKPGLSSTLNLFVISSAWANCVTVSLAS